MVRLILAGVLLSAAPFSAAAQTATTYDYDALGRLITLRDGHGRVDTYTFDSASNRSNVTSLNQFEHDFPAIPLYHIVGHAEAGGWAAGVEDPEGHLVYGPYTYDVSGGPHIAAYRMLIDNNNADNAAVAVLDVADGANGATIVSRTLYRNDWRTAGYYEVFELPFTLGPEYAGHPIEFRIYYLRTAYLRVSEVGYR